MSEVVKETGAFIHPQSVFECQNVTLRKYARVNGPMIVRGAGSLEVGPFCAIGWGLHVVNSDHVMNGANLQMALQKELGVDMESVVGNVKIGANNWIGDNVMMTAKASTGPGCIIGAGAVVTRSFGSFAIIAGNPARLIRHRFNERVRDMLKNLCWWDWSLDEIRKEHATSGVFDADLTSRTGIEILQEVVARRHATRPPEDSP